MSLPGTASCLESKALRTLTERLASELSRELVRQQRLVSALCQARADAMELTRLLAEPDDEDFALPLNELDISCSPSPARDSHNPSRLTSISRSDATTHYARRDVCGDDPTAANALLSVDDLRCPQQRGAAGGDEWNRGNESLGNNSLVILPAADRRLAIVSQEREARENENDEHSLELPSSVHSTAASQHRSVSASSLTYTEMNPLVSYAMTDGGTVKPVSPVCASSKLDAADVPPLDTRPIRDIPPEASLVSAINRVLPLPRPLQRMEGQLSVAHDAEESENTMEQIWHRSEQGASGLLLPCPR